MSFQKGVRFLNGALVLIFFIFFQFKRSKTSAAKATVISRFTDKYNIITIGILGSVGMQYFIFAYNTKRNDGN